MILQVCQHDPWLDRMTWSTWRMSWCPLLMVHSRLVPWFCFSVCFCFWGGNIFGVCVCVCVSMCVCVCMCPCIQGLEQKVPPFLCWAGKTDLHNWHMGNEYTSKRLTAQSISKKKKKKSNTEPNASNTSLAQGNSFDSQQKINKPSHAHCIKHKNTCPLLVPFQRLMAFWLLVCNSVVSTVQSKPNPGTDFPGKRDKVQYGVKYLNSPSGWPTPKEIHLVPHKPCEKQWSTLCTIHDPQTAQSDYACEGEGKICILKHLLTI